MSSIVFYCCVCVTGPAYIKDLYAGCVICHHPRCGGCELKVDRIDTHTALDHDLVAGNGLSGQVSSSHAQCVEVTPRSCQTQPRKRTGKSKHGLEDLQKQYAYLGHRHQRNRPKGSDFASDEVHQPYVQTSAQNSLRDHVSGKSDARPSKTITPEIWDDIVDWTSCVDAAHRSDLAEESILDSLADRKFGGPAGLISDRERSRKEVKEAPHGVTAESPGKGQSRRRAWEADAQWLMCPYWKRDPDSYPECGYRKGWNTVSRLR